MIISKHLPLFVVGHDGITKMTLASLYDATAGGTSLDDIIITTDESEAKDMHCKVMAMRRIVELVSNMTPAQAVNAVTCLQNRDDLMILHESDPTIAKVPLPRN